MSGLMNSLCIAVSMGLQYGVPPEVYVSKLTHMRFEPSGLTNDADIRVAKSIVDYIFRWFGKKFLTTEQQEAAGILSPEVKARLAQQYAAAKVSRRGGRGRWRRRRRGRRPCSTRGKTRSSAPSAAGGWFEPGRATRAGTAGLTPAVAGVGHVPRIRTFAGSNDSASLSIPGCVIAALFLGESVTLAAVLVTVVVIGSVLWAQRGREVADAPVV